MNTCVLDPVDRARAGVGSILVVDDLAETRDILRLRLRRRGYAVLTASSGAECLALLDTHHVALVLLDFLMPVMSGLEVLKEIQRRHGDVGPPVIMVTARDTPQEISAALELGAADYVTKPFDLSILEARIAAQLRRYAATARLQDAAQELQDHLHDATTRQLLDPLTRLPNRRAFEATLATCLARVRHRRQSCALAICHLDEFKALNDTYGHATGDQLLLSIARILGRQIRQGDHVARLGGNKFALLLENSDRESALAAAERIQNALREHSLQGLGEIIAVSISVGLTLVTPQHRSVKSLIHNAEHACQRAQALGRDQLQFFHEDDDQLAAVRSTTRWAMKLQKALQDDRLRLYVQPIVSATDPEQPPSRFEVLIRLEDEGRIVSPGEFLPAVERHGLATDLDRWVITRSLEYLQRLPPGRLQELRKLSINLSGLSLANSGFRQFLTNALVASPVPPGLLCFEITETAAVQELREVVPFIHALQQLGASFALDDFGAGVSSFGYLRSLPVDYVKVDGQFVRQIHESPVDRAIIRAIIDVAHLMDMQVVAEFVESHSAANVLRRMGCDLLQGYFIGKPLPIAEYLTDSSSATGAARRS